MVLPSTSSSLRQQDRRLNAIYRKNLSRDNNDAHRKSIVKEEAKRAVDQVLQTISATAADSYFTGSSSKGSNRHRNSVTVTTSVASKNTSGSSADSVGSTEIAIERGSMRAMLESNEHVIHRDNHSRRNPLHLQHLTDLDSHQSPTAAAEATALRGLDFDLATSRTLYGSRMPPLVEEKKGFLKKMLRKKKRTPPGMSVLVAGISKEAWMCGCCGKVFSTFDAADYHENKCILDVIGGAVLDPDEDGSQPLMSGEMHFRSPKYSPFGLESSSGGAFFPRKPPLQSAIITRTHGVMDDELMNDLGLGDVSDNAPSERSIYMSARSFQHDVPSPWRPASSLPTTPAAGHANMKVLPLRDTPPPSIKQRNVSFQDEAIPQRNPLVSSSVHFGGRTSPRHISPATSFDRSTNEPANLLLTRSMKQQVIVTDEALVNSVARAAELILTREERDAEKELACLAADKMYYEEMTQRACVLKAHPIAKFRSEGKSVGSKIQNKFVDAWQLIKEGDTENMNLTDEYGKKTRRNGVGKEELVHNANTHYVNVFVKHSLRVVNSELERLAQQRWEDHGDSHRDSKTGNFEQFRKFAHVNLVKLAKLALAADFTPRKVAVQLSNDLYRLMAPQLKRRGVAIDTEIEYRVGPYFVLAVNIISIDWTKLIKYSNRLVSKQKKQWIADQGRREELREELLIEERKHKTPQPNNGALMSVLNVPFRLYQLTKFDILAQFLSCMYYVHWTISIPVCWILFRFFIQSTMHKYILATVADEIFSYVEEKGMEMDIKILSPDDQAAFMLAALRDLRQDTKAKKDKTKDTEGEDKGVVLGPLMGPAIKSDNGPAPSPPPDFEMPEHLEFINLEISLPVGFKRLRWAMLSPTSNFSKDALLGEAKCENVIIKEWSHHNDVIGCPDLPEGVSEKGIIGAERESEYLMPKSTFVRANTVFDTSQIIAYNDYCLCIKKRTLSPDVPYGTTFITWTQILITNTGNDTCHLTTSVEAEFPNGPPIISRQIVSGMRSGTAESFILMGEIIIKYADEFP